jgi:hypothetical protein
MRGDPRYVSRTRIASISAPWLLALGLYVALLSTGTGTMDPATLGFLVVVGAWGVAQATVGALIALRRPDNRIGRVLQVTGPLVVSVFLGYSLAATRVLTHGPDDSLAELAGWWASTMIFPAIYLAFPVVGILFPDGHLPGPSWRLPVLITASVVVGVSGMFSLAAGQMAPGLPANPFGLVDIPAGLRAGADVVGPIALVVAMALAVASIAIRWRQGNHQERSQLKWLFMALLVAGVAFPFTFGSNFEGETESGPAILDTLGVGSVILIPLSIGIAVLRYRLYDIDRIVSRTIAWAAVSGALVAVFVGVVIALQAALAGVTQGQTMAVAGSTLIAAALFQPIRLRVQAAVDRRFDRARYDGRRTVDAFAEHLREEVDLTRLRNAVIATADEAVRPAATGLWLRGSAR